MWRDNSYPGLTCDVPSHLYSFSFEPKHDWSRRYPRREEILEYLEHCTDPEVQRIVLLDGPTVLGWEKWHEIDERHTFGLIHAALEEAVRAGAIQRQPTTPLAHLLLGAGMQAGMVVARADDPAAAKREMGKALHRLLATL